LKRAGDEGRLRGRRFIAADFSADGGRQFFRVREDKPAVAHDQGLLRHDRLRATVALFHAWSIKQRQEAEAVVASIAIVDGPARASLGCGGGEVWSTEMLVQPAGQGD